MEPVRSFGAGGRTAPLIPRALAAVCLASAAAACGTPAPEPAAVMPPRAEPAPAGGGEPGMNEPGMGIWADVVRIIDGDTLVISLEGDEHRLRLIGIDAPETGECLSREAGIRLGELASVTVWIETDRQPYDRHGRLLAYLWAEGDLVNERLAAEGLAAARAYEPNTARQPALQAAEDAARRSRLGMWADGACGAPPPFDIEITEIRWNPPGPDGDDLNGEYLVLTNLSDRPVDLSGFTLRDASASNRYRFPPGRALPARSRVTVHTGNGQDGPDRLYWGSDRPIWNNDGDRALLVDPAGNAAAEYSYRG